MSLVLESLRTAGRSLRADLPRRPLPVVRLVLALGLLVSAVVLTRLAADLGQGPRTELGYLLVLWVGFAGLSVAVLKGLPHRLTAVVVVLGTLAVSLAGVVGDDRWTWSTDQYRYRWDGAVSASGINPYRYDDSDPALAELRDPWLWPDAAGCEEAMKEPGCTRINHEGSHTVYPPVAQAYFLVVHALPGPAEEDRFKLWAGLLSSALTAALVLVLVRRGVHPAFAAAYGWGPLHGLESALDGHVDVLGVGLALAGALLVRSSRGSPRQKRFVPAWAQRFSSGHAAEILGGVLIGLGASTKFYPGVVLLALPPRTYWRAWLASAVTVVLTYVPFLISDPASVLGYLPTYVSSEGYGSGDRYLVLAGLGITGTLATVLVLGVLGVLAVQVMRQRVSLLSFLGVFFLLLTPVQTWYTIVLVVLAARHRRLEWLVVVAAAYPVYANPFGDRPLTGTVTYSFAAVVVVLVSLLRWLKARRVRAARGAEDPSGATSNQTSSDREGPTSTHVSDARVQERPDLGTVPR